MVDALGKSLRNLPGPVLITGHTGFKGTWMTLLLQELGVSVIGYSLQPEKGSLYERANLKGNVKEKTADIRDSKKLKKFIEKNQPSVIIHMAAQPLVLESYRIPRETFEVNVMGTANILDIAFTVKSVQVVLVVTTDKVYRNDNSGRTYVESDPLEGKDPYSASKVGTESVVRAWQQISDVSNGPKVVAVRAGNVIGGGDFAKNRLIPDIIRSHISMKPMEIRNPNGTRPWQHVLDVITAYLLTVERLLEGNNLYAINFGPAKKSLNVLNIVELSRQTINFTYKCTQESNPSRIHKSESETLNLDSNFALNQLNWKPKIDQSEALLLTLNWWKNVLLKKSHPKDITLEQIKEFISELKVY